MSEDDFENWDDEDNEDWDEDQTLGSYTTPFIFLFYFPRIYLNKYAI